MQAEKRQVKLADAFIAEIEQEGEITERLLDIIPEDKLSWRPHSKAKSLGELAMHVAQTQGGVAEMGDKDSVDMDFQPEPEATSRAQIIEAFAESLNKAKDIVASTSDERALQEWRLTKDGSTVIAMPRVALWRSIMLNHYIHHRGQLSTYLRTLDVPLPSIYGPSADTNPFA